MIPGLKVILMGPPGSGKTHSIRTLIEADLEVFCVLTEPNAINTLTNLRGASDKYKKALDDNTIHWRFIPPALATWDSLAKSAKKLSMFDLGTLQKETAVDKREYTQILEVYNTLSNFVDERTGKESGTIEKLDPAKTAVVIDSLSGLNTMFLSIVCGSKAAKTQPEWGAAIDAELRFINQICFGVPTHVVVMAHIAREVDEVLGGMKIMVNGIGRKAPQEIPKNFTDCILAKNAGGNFTWSTVDMQAETKSTTLVAGEKMEPSFVPLIDEWRTRFNINQGDTP